MMTFESWKGTTMVVPPNEKRIPLTDGAKRNSARTGKVCSFPIAPDFFG